MDQNAFKLQVAAKMESLRKAKDELLNGGIPPPERLDLLNGYDSADSGGKKFGCLICGKRFNLLRTYERHVADKHRVKTYHCKVCNQVFNNRQVLKEHCEAMHQEERVPCHLCDKTFTTRSSLRLHHDAIHKGIRYKCSHCDKSFGQLGSLRRHVNTIHEGLPFDVTSVSETVAAPAESADGAKNHGTTAVKTMSSSTTTTTTTTTTPTQVAASTGSGPKKSFGGSAKGAKANNNNNNAQKPKVKRAKKNSENVMYVGNKRRASELYDTDGFNLDAPAFVVPLPTITKRVRASSVKSELASFIHPLSSLGVGSRELDAIAILVSMKA